MNNSQSQSSIAMVEADHERLAELIELARESLPEISLYLERELKRIHRSGRSSERRQPNPDNVS